MHRAARSHPWPRDARARLIAAAKIADLNPGEALDVMVDHVIEGAARRWEELRATAR